MSAPLTAFPIPTTPLSGLGFGRVEYVSSYANLSAAITALVFVGSPVTLVIDIASSITANLNINAPITLAQQNGAMITIASGKTLYLQNMPTVGDSRFFIQADATANVTFGPFGYMRLAWFVGATPTACGQAINQILNSASNNGGGVLMFPFGTGWTSAGGHNLPLNTHIYAPGIYTTTLTFSAGGNYMFKLATGIRGEVFQGIIIDGNHLANTVGLLCQGAVSSGGDLQINDTIFQNCTYGIKIDDSNTGWQVANVSASAGSKLVNNDFGFYCNTPNSALQWAGPVIVGSGQWGMYLDNIGGALISGEFSGTVGTGRNQIMRQTVTLGGVVGVGIATSVVTAAGMIGSPVTVSVPINAPDGGGAITAALVAQAFCSAFSNDPNVSSFFHVSILGAVISLIALDPAAQDATMNFTIATGTATNITAATTRNQIVAGVVPGGQGQGVYLGGQHGPVQFEALQSEAFKNFLVTDAGTGSIVSFDGCIIQDACRLNQTTRVITKGCDLTNKTFRDGVAPFYSSLGGDEISPIFSGYDDVGASLVLQLYRPGLAPSNFTGVAGTGTVVRDSNISKARVASQLPLLLYRNNTADGVPSGTPWLTVLSTATGYDDILMRLGKGNKLGLGTYYYDFLRNNGNGHLVIQGNQAGATGLDINGPIQSQGLLVNYPSGFGYMAGSGGAVTQATSKSTATTLNGVGSGEITLAAGALAAGATVSFVLTANVINIRDVLQMNMVGTGTLGAYALNAVCGAGTATIYITNVTAASLNEQPTIRFNAIRGSIT